MFSHIVTAAKGLFTRQEPQDALADPAGASDTTTSNMVSTTKGGAVESEVSTDPPQTNGVAKHGKRKAQPANTEKTDDKQSKRRKRVSSDAADTTHDESSKKTALNDGKDQKPPASASRKHFRFDSEEPFVPEETQPEEVPQASSHDEEEEDSDDDAPETIDNSAQLLKMKEQAKKQEKAKQQYVPPASSYLLPWPFFLHLSQRGTTEEGKAEKAGRAPKITSQIIQKRHAQPER